MGGRRFDSRCASPKRPERSQRVQLEASSSASMDASSSRPTHTWLWSSLAVGLMVILLPAVLDWHAHHAVRVFSSSSMFSARRLGDKFGGGPRHVHRAVATKSLQQDGNTAGGHDDETRDAACRKYVLRFLNGTTDARDECAGMYNAYKAADCRDDQNMLALQAMVGRRHRADNGTVLHDDVVMDDDFENWTCCDSISEFYNKNCQPAVLDAWKLLGIVAVLVTCGWMKQFKPAAWIPDAGVCIVVGAITGALLQAINTTVVQDRLTFDNDLFLSILLPPIIFEAALTIDKRAFRRDLFPILIFAIVGTAFSALAIGYTTWYLTSLGRGTALPLLDALLYGSLISSVDPAATLGILSSVGVGQADTLYTLVFGESLLNDGVSIVLFDSFVQHVGDADVVTRATLQDILGNFLVVTLGSMAVGVLCGALCTLYFWALHGRQSPVTEVALFFCWALIPYYIADGVGLSGIIAIMVMGFMMDYFVIGGFQSEEGEWMEYMELRRQADESHPIETRFRRFLAAGDQAFSGRGHIHTRSRHHVGFVAEVIASIMETSIFAYLGVFLFNDRDFDLKLIATGLFSCISSRAVMVVALSLVINAGVWVDLEGRLGRLWNCCCRRRSSASLGAQDSDDDSINGPGPTKVYLDGKTQLILFTAGVRGAVSYALVQNIPLYNAVSKHGSKFKAELRAMTSATIVVILFTFGALTYFSVQRDLRPPPVVDDPQRQLTSRLLSAGLTSIDENNNEEFSDLNSSLEIESRPPRREEEYYRIE